MKKIKVIKSITIISALVLTSCAQLLQGKVEMDLHTTAGSLEQFITPPVKITSLEAPSQIYVSKGDFQDSIDISWNEVPNATSYTIERAVAVKSENGTWTIPDETEFEQICNYTNKTNYRDVILLEPGADNPEYNNVYYYRIAAKNLQLKLESEFSAVEEKDEQNNVINVNGEGRLLAPPANVEAWKGKVTDKIRVTWTGNSDAVSYVIYRGKDLENMEKIASVYGNQFSYDNLIPAANQGIEYYYKVEGVTANNKHSARSSEALGYALKEGAPVAPGNVKVKGLGVTKDNLEITWDEVSMVNVDSFSYSLYRNSSVDSVYTLIKSGLTVRNYFDSNVKPNVVYHYYVQSVAVKGDQTIKSPFSETGPESSEPARGFILSAPSTLEVADSDTEGTVLIRWKPAVGYDIEDVNHTYMIYGSGADGIDFEKLTDPVEGTLDTEGYLTYEVSNAYSFYKVTTCNETVGLESAMSTIIAPLPAAPVNVTASKTEKISEQWEPNPNGVYPVKITWQKPAEDNPAGYYVYRSNKIDSGYKKISDEVVTGTSFIDCGENFSIVRPATIYYYKVVSLNSLGQGKKSNDPATDEFVQKGKIKLRKSWGYGALTPDNWFRQYNKTVMRSQEKLTLMHKANDLDKVGKETIKGDLTGQLYYNAAVKGLGAYIEMKYTDYADYYINGDSEFGYYYFINGNTDTDSNMSANGHMIGTVVCEGMYPASAFYDKLEIKGGAAGGGSYGVIIKDLNGNEIIGRTEVDWKVGEEGRK